MDDGNGYALAMHEREVENNERAYDNFIEAVLASNVVNSYNEAVSKFDRLASNYGYSDITFEDFRGEHI